MLTCRDRVHSGLFIVHRSNELVVLCALLIWVVERADASQFDGSVVREEALATVELSVEFHKFYNVDLFQRG